MFKWIVSVDIIKYAQIYFFFVYLDNKPKPVMTQQPDVDKVYTGESVSFSCKVELTSGWEYSWFKDGVKQSIKSNIFTISAVSLSDSGTYDCMATRNKTMYETMHSDKRILQVSGEQQKPCVYMLCCLLFRGTMSP